jgi:hypothetical protein
MHTPQLHELQFERTAVILSSEVDKLQRLEDALSKLKKLKATFPDDK